MTGRNHEVRIKLSSEELNIVKTKAKIVGMPISSFLRALGLKGNIVTQ